MLRKIHLFSEYALTNQSFLREINIFMINAILTLKGIGGDYYNISILYW